LDLGFWIGDSDPGQLIADDTVSTDKFSVAIVILSAAKNPRMLEDKKWMSDVALPRIALLSG
jgi:hypothetical protein